jgi:hypothetical protein
VQGAAVLNTYAALQTACRSTQATMKCHQRVLHFAVYLDMQGQQLPAFLYLHHVQENKAFSKDRARCEMAHPSLHWAAAAVCLSTYLS